VGTVVVAIVKHVPTRGVLWAVLAFVIGWILVGLSIGIMALQLGRGLMILEILFPIPLAIPFLGAALFAVHGLQRGAARAALDLERRFGLVRYVVDRVMERLAPRVGGVLENLPVAEFDEHLHQALDDYFGSEDMNEGRGVVGWVLRRAKRTILDRLEPFLLAAYREELRVDGTGGGISLTKLGERAAKELSAKLAGLVMSPLRTQLLFLSLLYVAVGVGWFHILSGLLSLLSIRL
jgi:hypothetical protein